MVVLENLGLEVTIRVASRVAQEHPDQDGEAAELQFSHTVPTRHRYIESVDGAEFSIICKVQHGAVRGWLQREPRLKSGLLFSADIDGHDGLMNCLICSESIAVISGVQHHTADGTTLRNFRFAPVITVDEANRVRITEDKQQAQQLGTIRVRVHRVTWRDVDEPLWSSVGNQDPLTALEQTDRLTIAEKALKGRTLSHGSILSQSATKIYGPSKGSRICTYTDGRAKPIAVFYFKYRSREALQQELIIPRPRSVSPESDVANMPENEARRLASLYLAQTRGNKKRSASEIKTEHGNLPQSQLQTKKIKIGSGSKSVIDLTEDD